MGTFLDQARKTQDAKRGLDKDPADLSDSQEPDWDNPETWGGGGANTDAASGNAGDTQDQEQPDSRGVGQKPSRRKPAQAPARPPRRRGRPRGPERAMLSVRILAENDRKLTAAVEATGLNPQTLIDQALAAHFKRLKIEDPGSASARRDGAA